jgi:hypothetical protein
MTTSEMHQCELCWHLPRKLIISALCTIARVLNSPSNNRPSLNAALAILEQDLGMERGTVLLLSPDGSELLLEALRDPNRRQSCG